ncbi:hypothetical protein ETB97_011331, partial [Aspergillus alliaceus]
MATQAPRHHVTLGEFNTYISLDQGPGALPNHSPTEPADPDPDLDQLDQAQRLRQPVSHQASTVTLPQAILNRLLK